MSKILVVCVLSAVVTIGAATARHPSSDATGVDPLRNPSGLRAGLARVPKGELARARKLIRRVAVSEPSGPRYDRSAFGRSWTDDTSAPWAHDGCPTREQVLQRDMPDERLRAEPRDPPRCVVSSGTLHDPYTGSTIDFTKQRPQAVQVDHIVALAEAWRMGAWRWSRERREEYANDPLVLLAVDGPMNVRKSDHGPSEWLPPSEAVWCALSVRRAQVEVRYQLAATAADKRAMLRTCGG